MGSDTKIEWADHTFNAWIGCTKVSPACDFCYAEDWSKRYGRANWGPGEPRQRTAPANWKQPLAWDKLAAAEGVQRFVFTNSLADVFDNEVDPSWRRDLFRLIDETRNLTWLLLTKRVGNVEKMIDVFGANQCPSNAWLGITVVNQEEADRDIPKLLAAKAALGIPRVFLSIEPMLGQMDVSRYLWRDACTACAQWARTDCPKCGGKEHTERLDWVICGGESGKHARPMHPDWARSLRDQCADAGVPFLFKQWGEWLPFDNCRSSEQREAVSLTTIESNKTGNGKQTFLFGDRGSVQINRVGKKLAGRLIDGVEHNGRPQP